MAEANKEAIFTQDDAESGHISKHGDDEVAIHTETFAIKREALGEHLPPHYWRSPAFIGTVAALCFGNISNYVSWVLPSNSLLLINESIGPTLAYTLGLAVGFLIVGRLSDIFGRRWFFIGGNFLALLSGILGAVAKDVNTLIGGNILGGLAGAVQISFTVAIAELVPNKHRPLWVGAIFFSSFEFACFGPVLAQVFVANTASGWRVSYFINIAVSTMAVTCFFFFYHPPTFQLLHEDRTKMQQLKRQDFIGLLLFTGGLILFIMGLSWGGGTYPWNSAHVIACIVVGFLTLVAFVLWDAYGHHGDPLLPLHLFKTRGYLAMVLTAMVGSCVYYSMNVLWPQQIAYLFGGSTTHHGWLACVVGGSCLIGQVSGAVMCRYIKKSRYILIGGTLSLLAFSAAMRRHRRDMLAVSRPARTAIEDIGAALGALGSIRSGGASVATAIYVAILTNKLTKYVPEYVTPAALNAGLPETSLKQLFAALTTGAFAKVPGITPEIIAAVGAANASAGAKSFQYVWYAVVAFCCVAVVAACLTVNYGEYLTDTVERKLQIGGAGHDDEKA
ncbi:hypothetical protein LTR91_007168 [Friedmanniomyces endolithicus]|uniref:Major facilitator superfamily (MFS) profile domain-containing protein n=1 Tax=Friedmanniomyces endolithicus TaxID=329885 RepID=A0AAN6KRC0_9PEZI|nr:hypothetical protein LTR94_006124 [Friedmanniomyces endolithicus]KAK0802543.1 hypothetical protein LTR59_004982 [Friedmanniomyces endolithicus]KAK0855375.1 hypothetical protein LTR03_001826 [Friedmanniomyces endolithicus]KAK0867273.1 hypothetical protein LTS02_004221 [Friedmanniomyces endolithicus]KAK0904549.1 hypothetical protein LTR57_018658 [Friedmanniomyces endolithicus]